MQKFYEGPAGHGGEGSRGKRKQGGDERFRGKIDTQCSSLFYSPTFPISMFFFQILKDFPWKLFHHVSHVLIYNIFSMLFSTLSSFHFLFPSLTKYLGEGLYISKKLDILQFFSQ